VKALAMGSDDQPVTDGGSAESHDGSNQTVGEAPGGAPPCAGRM